jgi:hypothetical protein
MALVMMVVMLVHDRMIVVMLVLVYDLMVVIVMVAVNPNPARPDVNVLRPARRPGRQQRMRQAAASFFVSRNTVPPETHEPVKLIHGICSGLRTFGISVTLGAPQQFMRGPIQPCVDRARLVEGLPTPRLPQMG